MRSTVFLGPAMAAVKAGRVDALRVLLAHGAALDLDAVYPDGRTVREWARDSGVPQMAEFCGGLGK